MTGYCLFPTPLGTCALAWHGEDEPTLFRLRLPEATLQQTEARIAADSGATSPSDPPPEIAAVLARLGQHLAGDLQDFSDVPLDLTAAPTFARQVYVAARAIPSGATCSYGDLAAALGKPRAARAVGQALGRNPVALLVPCHRILAAGGKLGGFSAHLGPTIKTRLLAIEGVTV